MTGIHSVAVFIENRDGARAQRSARLGSASGWCIGHINVAADDCDVSAVADAGYSAGAFC